MELRYLNEVADDHGLDWEYTERPGYLDEFRILRLGGKPRVSAVLTAAE
jgi:hypothetical protein